MSTVRTQQELDAALIRGEGRIEIRSEHGVWLTVTATDSAAVHAYDSATVRATDSAAVTAYGSATVHAYDSATVRATDSAAVHAYDSATVRATDSAAVTAYGSAAVTAYGSATVHAYGSATVHAYDSATVRAYGSAAVRATGSATVTATPKVAVHLHNANATVFGGVVIDVSRPVTDPQEWCRDNGVTVTRAGIATLYKAVDDQWTTLYGTDYSPGSKPSCDDWRDDHNCGGGLHFSPSPTQALAYHNTATRFVAVGVKVTDLRPIPGAPAKAKAPRVVRACRHVDINGNEVPA